MSVISSKSIYTLGNPGTKKKPKHLRFNDWRSTSHEQALIDVSSYIIIRHWLQLTMLIKSSETERSSSNLFFVNEWISV